MIVFYIFLGFTFYILLLFSGNKFSLPEDYFDLIQNWEIVAQKSRPQQASLAQNIEQTIKNKT